MEKITPPTVTELAIGSGFAAKQMQAKADEVLPKHRANLESIVFIYEGECILRINNEEILLKPGQAIVIPPMIKHQIRVLSDFKGIHFMPKEIKFEFFK
jgi:quercetin dioxygenase-like cupin family protein